MNNTLTLAKREFIGFFASPIALAFLGLFLVGSLIKFFNIDFFFSYGLADVRSLFANMPLMMIFLVAALTMKLWSEEQKQGTLEILMTLPLSNFQLVMGKFLAGWTFIGVALLFTLGLPITVSLYGPLDWGPVWGGYFAAFFMGGAYLSIGLCVSALTENQVFSLMLTLTIGLFFYILGYPGVAEVLAVWIESLLGLFHNSKEGWVHRIEDVVMAFGTGSRFRSIEKGLLDNRDLLWYVSIMVFFLVLNSHFINRKRQLSPKSTLKFNSVVLVLLVGVNLTLMNVSLASEPLFRIDLTEGKMFSLSDETIEQLKTLDEKLTVELIFSDDMPEYLRPLVPQIKDMVDEYQIQSGGRLRKEVSKDPNQDEDLKRRLMIHYNIMPFALIENTSKKRSVIQTYFHVIVRYGDRFQILTKNQLVEQRHDENGVQHSLRSFEQQLSRSIRNLFNQFQNFESVFSHLKDPLQVKLYYPFSALEKAENAELYKRYLDGVQEVIAGIQKIGDKGFDFSENNYETMKELPPLFRRLNLPPPSEENPITITMEYGKQASSIKINIKDGVREIHKAIFEKAQGMLPGFTRTIGLWVPGPATEKQARKLNKPFRFRRLESFLSTFSVIERIDFSKSAGAIPANIDVLLVVGVETATLKERFAFDQFVMQGKPLIYAAGYSKLVNRRERDPAERNPPWYEMTHSKDLGDILRSWGVVVEDYMAQDTRCLQFIDYRKYDSTTVWDRGMIDVRHPELSLDHDVTGSLKGGLLMAWSSPLKLDANQSGIEVMASTTKDSWKMSLNDLRNERNSPFVGNQPLAVTITGKRDSFFSNVERLKGTMSSEELEAIKIIMQQGFIPSNDNVRLAVVGCHDFVSDIGEAFIGSLGWSPQGANSGWNLFPSYGVKLYQNLKFMGNLVDWGVNENHFYKSYSSEASVRLLEPMPSHVKRNFQIMNYAIVLFLLAGVLVGFWALRKLKAPLINFSESEVL